MFEPKFFITNNINNSLLEIERARGFLDAAQLKKSWIRNMQGKALILESHASTHIEGTRLTLSQARKILTGKKVAGVNPDDRKELLNYKEAIDFVSKYLGKEDFITENLICDIHKILVKGVRGNSAGPGNYRKVQNYIINSISGEIIYTPPPPERVSSLMKEFVVWLNKKSNISPVLRAGINQFQFVHIHPFLDGNGRTARLLCTLILYKNGYDFKRLFSFSEFYNKKRRKYYDAIQSVRKNNMDMTEWLGYFTDGLKSQMLEVKNKGEMVIKKDILLDRALKFGLGKRQLRGIKFLIRQGQMQPAEYMKINPDITHRTAQRDIKELLEKEFIIRKGATNKLVYFLKI
ncbi:Fic family protein [candidate division WOR-3 bacterium]|nr:Fic family protein [candidate division WOR-3 bacterium]